MDITDAFKAFRRNSYVYKDNWRAAVICATPGDLEYAFEIARLTTEASSMRIERIVYLTHTIDFSPGSSMRFYLVQGPLDAYLLAGQCFAHIMLVGYEAPPAAETYLRSMLHSPVIEDSDKLLFQTGVFV